MNSVLFILLSIGMLFIFIGSIMTIYINRHLITSRFKLKKADYPGTVEVYEADAYILPEAEDWGDYEADAYILPEAEEQKGGVDHIQRRYLPVSRALPVDNKEDSQRFRQTYYLSSPNYYRKRSRGNLQQEARRAALREADSNHPQTPIPNYVEKMSHLEGVSSIFVSHSSMDDSFSVKLVEDLRNVFGTKAVWYDSKDGLNPGDRWFRRIEEELVKRDVFLIILSPKAMNSDWVRREFDIALNEKKRIVPVLYKPCEMWPYLRTVHYVSFLPSTSYKVAFDNLLRALSADKSA